MAEKLITKSFERLLDKGKHRGFITFEELGKSLGKRNGTPENIEKAFSYALNNSKSEISKNLKLGNAINLPWPSDYFDLVISINTLHCLHAHELDLALREMERVGKRNKYLCVESFRNEKEKANLLYWQVTCEAFNNIESWKWWFSKTGYNGDYSFIFFE